MKGLTEHTLFKTLAINLSHSWASYSFLDNILSCVCVFFPDFILFKHWIKFRTVSFFTTFTFFLVSTQPFLPTYYEGMFSGCLGKMKVIRELSWELVCKLPTCHALLPDSSITQNFSESCRIQQPPHKYIGIKSTIKSIFIIKLYIFWIMLFLVRLLQFAKFV